MGIGVGLPYKVPVDIWMGGQSDQYCMRQVRNVTKIVLVKKQNDFTTFMTNSLHVLYYLKSLLIFLHNKYILLISGHAMSRILMTLINHFSKNFRYNNNNKKIISDYN